MVEERSGKLAKTHRALDDGQRGVRLHRVRRGWTALVGVTLSLSIAACGIDFPANTPSTGDTPIPGDTSSPGAQPVPHHTITLAPEAPPPPGVHLSFVQQRLDEGTRKANISVINGTESIVRVRSVALDWPGYPAGAQRLIYPVPALSTIDLAYQMPRAVCTPAAGAAKAHAIITTSHHRYRRTLSAAGTRFLTRLWGTECHLRRLRQTLSVGYGDPATWTEHGRGLRAVLNAQMVLHRTSNNDRVDVDQVQGSVLFALKLRSVRPLSPTASALTLPLSVSPGRCDEHGLSQSQQTFVWRIWFKLDGGEPTSQVVTPNHAQQARLLTFLDRACAQASG